MFIGGSTVNLDAKGRLAFPTRYRDELMERCEGKVVLTVDENRCLNLYPQPDWEELQRSLVRMPNQDGRVRTLQRMLLGHATPLELDKNGRVLIPTRLREFAGREHELPIDQHFLKALVAPRALICTDALDDVWANPKGNRATSRAAQAAFDLTGASNKNGLHFRKGGHDLRAQDWSAILDFADWHLRGKRPKNRKRFRQF